MSVGARMRGTAPAVEVGAVASPADLAGLAVWLDASQITGLANADPVTSWADLSGQGHHAVQATGSLQPTYRTNVQNGLAVVRFDGTDDYLASAAFAANITQPTTIFAVCKLSTTAPATQIVVDGIDTTERQSLYAITTGPQFRIFAGTVLNGAPADTAWHVRGAVFKGATSSSRLDGALTATGPAGSGALSGVTIGAAFDTTSGRMNGDVGEVIVYNRQLFADEIDALETHLGTKWGVTIT